MAICDSDNPRSVSGKHEMSVEEFKKWLMTFDSDKDGRINRKELRRAMRTCGVWFQTGRGMREADKDGSGYIDEDEIGDSFLDFAEKSMGFKFY